MWELVRAMVLRYFIFINHFLISLYRVDRRVHVYKRYKRSINSYSKRAFKPKRPFDKDHPLVREGISAKAFCQSKITTMQFI